MESVSVPIPNQLGMHIGCLCHRSAMKHWKSIIQRGLIGGGFGVARNQELQLLPFLPWDYYRNMASGRDSWTDDFLIALDHDRVFS